MRLASNYEAQLIAHFQRVCAVGASTIPAYDLRVWHNQERITITVWRTINEYWKEFMINTNTIPPKAKKVPLFIGDAVKEAQSFTLIWGEGLVETDKTWFKKLESWT